MLIAIALSGTDNEAIHTHAEIYIGINGDCRLLGFLNSGCAFFYTVYRWVVYGKERFVLFLTDAAKPFIYVPLIDAQLRPVQILRRTAKSNILPITTGFTAGQVPLFSL